MKRCPFCAEEIQDAAIKCRHCGSMLNEVPPAAAAAPTMTSVIFEGTPAWTAQLGAHVLAGALVVAGVTGAAVLRSMFAVDVPVAVGAGAALALVGVIWMLALWVKRFVRFRITTSGIDIESGLIGKRIETMQLWKIRDLEYQQTALDRLLGLARIRVVSQDVSSPDLMIWGLPSARAIFEGLKRSVDLARQSRHVVGLVE